MSGLFSVWFSNVTITTNAKSANTSRQNSQKVTNVQSNKYILELLCQVYFWRENSYIEATFLAKKVKSNEKEFEIQFIARKFKQDF